MGKSILLAYSYHPKDDPTSAPDEEVALTNLLRDKITPTPLYPGGETLDQVFKPGSKTKDDIQILHYAGHAYDDSLPMNLPGGDPDFVLTLDIKAFSDIIKDRGRSLKLIFLNACNTANGAKYLVEAGEVPVAIGTSIPVKNKYALRFAKEFYDLFVLQGQNVQDALRQAHDNINAFKEYQLFDSKTGEIVTALLDTERGRNFKPPQENNAKNIYQAFGNTNMKFADWAMAAEASAKAEVSAFDALAEKVKAFLEEDMLEEAFSAVKNFDQKNGTQFSDRFNVISGNLRSAAEAYGENRIKFDEFRQQKSIAKEGILDKIKALQRQLAAGLLSLNTPPPSSVSTSTTVAPPVKEVLQQDADLLCNRDEETRQVFQKIQCLMHDCPLKPAERQWRTKDFFLSPGQLTVTTAPLFVLVCSSYKNGPFEFLKRLEQFVLQAHWPKNMLGVTDLPLPPENEFDLPDTNKPLVTLRSAYDAHLLSAKKDESFSKDLLFVVRHELPMQGSWKEGYQRFFQEYIEKESANFQHDLKRLVVILWAQHEGEGESLDKAAKFREVFRALKVKAEFSEQIILIEELPSVRRLDFVRWHQDLYDDTLDPDDYEVPAETTFLKARKILKKIMDERHATSR